MATGCLKVPWITSARLVTSAMLLTSICCLNVVYGISIGRGRSGKNIVKSRKFAPRMTAKTTHCRTDRSPCEGGAGGADEGVEEWSGDGRWPAVGRALRVDWLRARRPFFDMRRFFSPH